MTARTTITLLYSCNVTRVVARRFGGWGQKFVSQKPTRVYSMKSARESLRDDEELKRQFQNQRREKELAEVRQKLGEKLLDGDCVLIIIQEISMVVGTNRAQKKVITFFDPGSLAHWC